MRLKSVLFATTAAVLLTSASSAQAEGLYFSTLGGANFLNDEDGGPNFFEGKLIRTHYEPDTGFLIGTAVGLSLDHWLHGFKVELEASYRRNDVDGRWEGSDPFVDLGALATTSGDISANMSTFALMANAWYEFNIGSRFKPYIGGGVGWARSRLDGAFLENNVRRAAIEALVTNPFDGFVVENSGFAYQLGIGVTSEIMPGVSLGLGYRFFDGPNNELFFGGKILSEPTALAPFSGGSTKFDNINQSVALSLTIDIN